MSDKPDTLPPSAVSPPVEATPIYYTSYYEEAVECLSVLGLTGDGVTLAGVQRSLHVSAPTGMRLLALAEAVDHRAVTDRDGFVERNGVNLVTIESRFLSGRPEFSREDERVIREAGEHLLAFIGPEACEHNKKGHCCTCASGSVNSESGGCLCF